MVKLDWVRVETELAKHAMTKAELASRAGLKVATLEKYLNMGKSSYTAAKDMAKVLGLGQHDLIIWQKK
ncbi:MAG: hypothetical protein IJQ01_06205 [Selenomonadaceae bacterium]|nr:hypothetical protein [Selenomonadaceae bacterium]